MALSAIGYERAKGLMIRLDWKARVTMDCERFVRMEVYDPVQKDFFLVRRDSARRLIPECRVCGRVNDETAILCYDHDGADEDLI